MATWSFSTGSPNSPEPLTIYPHLLQNTSSNLAFLAFCSLGPAAVLRTNSARGRILPRPSWESFVVGTSTWLGRTPGFGSVLCGSVLVRLMNEQEIERKNLTDGSELVAIIITVKEAAATASGVAEGRP